MMGVFFMYPIDRFFVITSPPKTLKTIFSKNVLPQFPIL